MTRRFIGLLILAVALLGAFPVPAAFAQGAPPPLPHAFFGAVEVNGQPAPVGTVIEARGANVLTDDANNPITVTTAGRYGGPTRSEIKLMVQGDLVDDQPIEFYVNGVKAQCAKPGETWQDNYRYIQGVITELNLRVGSAQPPAEPSPTSSPTVGVTTQPPAEPTATLPAPTATTTAVQQPTATPRVAVQATAVSTPTSAPAAPTVALVTPRATALPGAVVSKPTGAAPAAATEPAPEPVETQPAEPAAAPVATTAPATLPEPTDEPTVAPTATAAQAAAPKPNATVKPILEQAQPPETVQAALSQTNESGAGRSIALWGGLGVLLVAVAVGVLIKVRGLPR